jgi:adenine-specific DNA-methyltransferase
MPQDFKPQYTFTDDRLNELKQLFPEAWEDGVFNVDTLKTLIGDFSTDNSVKEHFGLNWVGKQDARKIAAKPPTGTLKPCLGEGVNEDTTENIFIEGENLEVLKILRKSYMGKIKMIYIDPPYNTGNDFIYNDTFADSTEDYLRKTGEKSDEGLLVSNPKSSGKYHASWLTFMYPRLRLAKDLLKEDGVIFISIGEDEIDNLTLMSKEIFGEENFLGCAARVSKKANNQGDFWSPNFDYVLTFTKNRNNVRPFFGGVNTKEYKHQDESGNRKGELYQLIRLYMTSLDPLRGCNNQRYWIECPDGTFVIPPGKIFPKELKDGAFIPPITGDDKVWRWSYKSYLEKKEQLLVKKVKSSNLIDQDGNPAKWNVFTKTYLNDVIAKSSAKPNSLIEEHINQKSSHELNELNIPFSFAKPSSLIKYLSEIMQIDKEDIIMDFFAGSASSGHSVIDLNSSDNGNRKFILIQLPEKIEEKSDAYKKGFKYINEISKKRLTHVIDNLDKTQGFKVFKQDNSTIYKWQDFKSEQDGALPDLFSKMELAYKNPLQDGVTTQDFITEIILQEGFPLTAKQEEVASGIFKITHEWLPYTLYATMLYSFKNTDFSKLQLQDTDHFVCLDKAFESNDALKQTIDNQCKLFTI